MAVIDLLGQCIHPGRMCSGGRPSGRDARRPTRRSWLHGRHTSSRSCVASVEDENSQLRVGAISKHLDRVAAPSVAAVHRGPSPTTTRRSTGSTKGLIDHLLAFCFRQGTDSPRTSWAISGLGCKKLPAARSCIPLDYFKEVHEK